MTELSERLRVLRGGEACAVWGVLRSDCRVPGHAGVRLGTAQECVSGSLCFFPSRGDPGLASLAQSQGRANPGSAGTTTHSVLTATGRSGSHQPISLRRKAGSEGGRPRSCRQSPNEGGGRITALAHGKRGAVGRSRQLRGPRSRAGCGPRRDRCAALRVHPARPRPSPGTAPTLPAPTDAAGPGVCAGARLARPPAFQALLPEPRRPGTELVPHDGMIRTVVRGEAGRDFRALFPAWPWP